MSSFDLMLPITLIDSTCSRVKVLSKGVSVSHCSCSLPADPGRCGLGDLHPHSLEGDALDFGNMRLRTAKGHQDLAASELERR